MACHYEEEIYTATGKMEECGCQACPYRQDPDACYEEKREMEIHAYYHAGRLSAKRKRRLVQLCYTCAWEERRNTTITRHHHFQPGAATCDKCGAKGEIEK